MDGLASGRPFISTAVPEATLYSDYIHIVDAASEAAGLIGEFLSGQPAHDTSRQLEFARKNTWCHRASKLRQILADL
jgi:hypothetical protein